VHDAFLDARNEGAGRRTVWKRNTVRYRRDLEILGEGGGKWKLRVTVCGRYAILDGEGTQRRFEKARN